MLYLSLGIMILPGLEVLEFTIYCGFFSLEFPDKLELLTFYEMGESLQKLWSFYMKLTPRLIPAVPVRDNSFIPTALRKKKNTLLSNW